MAFKVLDFAAWRVAAQTYWDGQIDATSFTNKVAMKADVTTFLGELQVDFDAYEIGATRDDLRDILIPLFTYTVMRFDMTFPEDTPPGVVQLIGDDVRNLFEQFNRDIVDETTIFLLVPGVPVTIGVVQKEAPFNTEQAALQGGNAADSALLNSFVGDVADSIADQMIFLVYGQPKTVSAGVDIVNQIRVVMFLDEVLTFTGFTFIGINA